MKAGISFQIRQSYGCQWKKSAYFREYPKTGMIGMVELIQMKSMGVVHYGKTGNFKEPKRVWDYKAYLK